jgi:hypothetical protein
MTIGTFKHTTVTLSSASLFLSLATMAQGQPAGSASPIRSEVASACSSSAASAVTATRPSSGHRRLPCCARCHLKGYSKR